MLTRTNDRNDLINSGEKLYSVRDRLDVSLEVVSAYSRIPVQHLSDFENNRRPISPKKALLLTTGLATLRSLQPEFRRASRGASLKRLYEERTALLTELRGLQKRLVVLRLLIAANR